MTQGTLTVSTRVATLEIGGSFAVSDLGIRNGYHNLSHHGQLPQNIDQLVQIERYQMEQFAHFLAKLQSVIGIRGEPIDMISRQLAPNSNSLAFHIRELRGLCCEKSEPER